jgi:hypothetical protein
MQQRHATVCGYGADAGSAWPTYGEELFLGELESIEK